MATRPAPPAQDVKPARRLLPIVIGGLALALYLALPSERSFSDSQYLVRQVAGGPEPYYNFAYIPLGYLLHAALETLCGWSVQSTLLALSGLCLAGAAALTARMGLQLGLGLVAATFGGLLFAASPAALFFGGTIEVHALQALGAATAISLAWSAGRRQGRFAWGLLVLALVVALATHLTHVLLLPALVLLAWRRDARDPDSSGCRLGRGWWLWLLAALLGAGAAGLALQWWGFEQGPTRGELRGLSMPLLFAEETLGAFGERGLFSFGEVCHWLWLELAAPAGLLALGCLIWPLARRGGDEATLFVRRGLLGLLPALCVLTQGGVYERGGYMLSYFPILALSLAWGWRWIAARGSRVGGLKRGHAGLLALLTCQLLLALDSRLDVRARPDARMWSTRVTQHLMPGDTVLVTSLARTFALAKEASLCHVSDLKRQLQLVPRAGRNALLERVFVERFDDERYPGALFLDSELLPDEGRAPWQQHLGQLLDDPRVRVATVGEQPYRLLRLVLVN